MNQGDAGVEKNGHGMWNCDVVFLLPSTEKVPCYLRCYEKPLEAVFCRGGRHGALFPLSVPLG